MQHGGAFSSGKGSHPAERKKPSAQQSPQQTPPVKQPPSSTPSPTTGTPGGRYGVRDSSNSSCSPAVRRGMLTLAVAPESLLLGETVWLPSPNLKQRLEATLLCREIMQEVVAAALAAATSGGQPGGSVSALRPLPQDRSTAGRGPAAVNVAAAAVQDGSSGVEPGQHSQKAGGGCCSIM